MRTFTQKVFFSISILSILTASALAAEPSVTIDKIVHRDFVEEGFIRFYVDVLDLKQTVVEELDGDQIEVQIDGEVQEGHIDVTDTEEMGEGIAVMMLLPAYGQLLEAEIGPAALKQIINGATTFLDKMKGADYVSIYFYTGDRLDPALAFTRDLDAAKNILKSKAQEYLGLIGASDQPQDQAEPRVLKNVLKTVFTSTFSKSKNLPRRRAVLLVTAGHDALLHKSPGKFVDQKSKLVKYATKKKNRGKPIKLYVLGIPGIRDTDLQKFANLATELSGSSLVPEVDLEFRDFPEAFERMADRMLKQYVVDWFPSDWSGGPAEFSFAIDIDGQTTASPKVKATVDELPSNFMGTVIKILMYILGIALVLFIIKKILDARANRSEPVYEQEVDQSAAARAMLQVVSGPYAGQEIYLIDEVTSFGRSDACDYQIEDPSMSRRHAAIRIDNMRFELSDVKSASGTFVNGRRIEKCFLRNGDKVQFAKTEMIFSLLR